MRTFIQLLFVQKARTTDPTAILWFVFSVFVSWAAYGCSSTTSSQVDADQPADAQPDVDSERDGDPADAQLDVDSERDGDPADAQPDVDSERDGDPTCMDECTSEGETSCVGERDYIVCGDHDLDPCVEWSSARPCEDNMMCSLGACRCDSGFADCNESSVDGCETDLTNDVYNCGGCGESCGYASVCRGSRCDCDVGRGNCDDDWANGCEIILTSSDAHCGACHRSCGTRANCNEGECECGLHFRNCDGDWTNGCEVCILTDTDNCGECGNVCAAAENTAVRICDSTKCTYGWCLYPYTDLDGDQENGCEEEGMAFPFRLGGLNDDFAIDVTTIDDGGFVVVGKTKSFPFDMFTDSAAWVVRVALDGTIDWQTGFGGAWSSIARSICRTTDGGYAFVGEESFSGTGYDGWLVRLDAEGEFLWSRAYGDIGLEGYGSFRSIRQTVDGGFIVGGDSNEFVPETDVGVTGAVLTDVWILKLNSLGEIEWDWIFGNTYIDHLMSVELARDGGYLVAANLRSRPLENGPKGLSLLKLSVEGDIEWQMNYLSDGLGISAIDTVEVALLEDGGYVLASESSSLVLIKISDHGDIEWQWSYQREDGLLRPRFIRETVDGGLVVAAITSLRRSSNMDMAVLKLSADGALEWQRSYGGIEDDHAVSILETDEGGFILVGYTESFGPYRFRMSEDFAICILKLNADGSVDGRCPGGIGSDLAVVTSPITTIVEDITVRVRSTTAEVFEVEPDVIVTDAVPQTMCITD